MITFVDLIPLAGALLALLILVGLTLRAQAVSQADYFLLLFLFVCFLSLVHRFLTHSGFIVEFIHLSKLNYLLGILRPPLFFLYIYYAIHPKPRFAYGYLIHFLPFAILLIYLSPYLVLSREIKLSIFNGQLNDPTRLPGWYFYFGIAYSIIYLAISTGIFFRASARANYLKPATRRWIIFFLTAHGAFIAGAILILLTPRPGDWELLAYHVMTFSMVIGCVVLLANLNGHITEAVRPRSYTPAEQQARTAVFERACRVIESEKLYLNDSLRIKEVAEKTNVQEYLLSQIINDLAGKSFTELINQHRITEAKLRLVDRAFAHLTVEAIGSDSGFSSKASFYAAFKKHAGVTPRDYRQKHSR